LLETGQLPQAEPTERVSAIARAWWGPVRCGQKSSLPFCIVAVTSRLNLIVVKYPPGLENTDTKGAVEEMMVLSFRPLRRLKGVTLNPRMRQFMGLWWDPSTQVEPREVIIFENSARSWAFQQALQIVPGDKRVLNPNGSSREEPGLQKQRGGIPVFEMRTEVMDSLEMTSKKDRGPDVNIISVMFVRSQQSSTTATWGCGAVSARNTATTTTTNETEAEVLVLTTDTVCLISIQSFLQQYARADDWEYFASDDFLESQFQDSDSEDDTVPKFGREKHLHAENLEQMQAMRGSPWQFGMLQGVWFLAEAESKARLQFGKNVEEIFFTSDGERQRFRRQLANALAAVESRERTRGSTMADGGKEVKNNNWSVMPSDKTNLNEVKKHAKEVRVQGKNVTALGNSSRGAR